MDADIGAEDIAGVPIIEVVRAAPGGATLHHESIL
jgi:hypothetical protein